MMSVKNVSPTSDSCMKPKPKSSSDPCLLKRPFSRVLKSPSAIYSSKSRHGKDGQDVVYDRFIASRCTSPFYSNNNCQLDKARLKLNRHLSFDSLLHHPASGLSSGTNSISPSDNHQRLNFKRRRKESDDDSKLNSDIKASHKDKASKLNESTESVDSSPTDSTTTHESSSDNESESPHRNQYAPLCLPATRQLRFHTPRKRNSNAQRVHNGSSQSKLNHSSDEERIALRRALFVAPKKPPAAHAEPFRTLDAPGIGDNFYLSLLDWSARDAVAVALDRAVYIYGFKSHAVAPLFETSVGNGSPSALAWDPQGACLAVGFSGGQLELWDAAAGRLRRRIRHHSGRIGTASWSDHLLATGGKDRQVRILDIRTRSDGARLAGHKQEVCGVRFAPREPRRLASGGNDNRLLIWDVAASGLVRELTGHSAAVKAFDWAPFSPHLLASGGGRGDNSLRLWDTRDGTEACRRLDVGAQVCALRWSPNSDEMACALGFPRNQLGVFAFDGKEIKRVAALKAHRGRVLHLGLSPDGSSVVSGSSDETLKFWTVFPGPRGSELRVPQSPSRLILPPVR